MTGHAMHDLFLLDHNRRCRVSSFDRTGGNHDWMDLPAGETRTFADITGCGIIRHIWITHWTGDPDWNEEPLALCKLVLRIYWDGEETPSVEVPLGDFFGLGFGRRMNYSSAAFSVNPEDGRGMNCFFPMPFATGARFTIESGCDNHTNFYFYVDYDLVDQLPEDAGRFHAQWRREACTDDWAPKEIGLLEREKANVPEEPAWVPKAWLQKNLDGAGNYVILDARGHGKYVGCFLNIDVFEPQCNQWYGEGDDMIFVDGELRLNGTGTEDYFNTAFSPTQTYASPYSGLLQYNGDPEEFGYKYAGKNSMYRLHIADPITFEESIRVTIEHGHANKLSNDYSSTAFWYQSEPHACFPPLPPLEKRLPREETSPQEV